MWQRLKVVDDGEAWDGLTEVWRCLSFKISRPSDRWVTAAVDKDRVNLILSDVGKDHGCLLSS